MRYFILIFLSSFSISVIAQEIDSSMIYIEQEFFEYDLPNSDSAYLDSTYRTENTATGFVGGLGYNNGFVIEVGYGKAFVNRIEKRSAFQSFYGGVEVLPSTDNKFIVAPKASIWIEEATYLTAVGLNLVYYTDFNQATLRLRPEIGIGYKKMKLTYGYNFPLVIGNLTDINKHNFGLAYFFETKKKSSKKTSYRQFLQEQKDNYTNREW